MAVDFLDIAPLEAAEWTVSIKDKDGNGQEVAVFPFDSSDLALLARIRFPQARVIFTGWSTPDELLDFINAKPHVMALAFLGKKRIQDKATYDRALASIRAMPDAEQKRLFGLIWAQVYPDDPKKADEENEPDAPPMVGEAAGDAVSPMPSSS